METQWVIDKKGIVAERVIQVDSDGDSHFEKICEQVRFSNIFD